VKQWIPPLNASGLRGNPVTLFMINLYYYNMMMPEEALVLRNLMQMLSSHEYPDGLVVLANIGHHLSGERSNPTAMTDKISGLLVWLQVAIISELFSFFTERYTI
jgi:hypothetical protein